jgi:hypothetical protein
MNRLTETGRDLLKMWLVRECSDQAGGGTGIALLDAQITELERRCALIHDRVVRKRLRADAKPGKPHPNGNHHTPRR